LGTTVSTSRTVGVQLTQQGQSPILVTPTGAIVTTGLYAIEDTVAVGPMLTNKGELKGQYGVIAYGTNTAIANSATISGTAGYGVFLVNNGTIVNGSTTDTTAAITGTADGIVEGGSGASAVTNYGTIGGQTGISESSSGPVTVDNLGRVNGGIFSANFAAVDNFGSIAGGGDGIEVTGGGNVVNGNATDLTASIVGSSYGIFIGSADNSTVNNFGSIKGTSALGSGIASSGSGKITIINGSATDTSAVISGGEGIGTAGLTTLTNFGSISGSSTGVFLGNGGSVTNGSATDTKASIIGGVRIAGGTPDTVNNFGSLIGGVAVGAGGGSVINGSSTDKTATITGPTGSNGVSIGGTSGTLTNYGTITANVIDIVFSGSGTVVNAGTIAAGNSSNTAIDFNPNYTNRLVEDPGSVIVGNVTGGSSTTLELAGGSSSGSVTGLGASIGAGTVDVDTGAAWTLTGANTAADFINDGTVAIASGGTLDISTAVDPSSSGIFQLMTKGSLEIGAILGTNLKIQFIGSAPTNKLTIDSAANFGTHVGTTSYAGPLLEGFSAGDVIDLKGIASTGLNLAYSTTTQDLQITGSTGSALGTLAFQNTSLGAGVFHAASDGAGGTLITHS
jgi:hypothetical protein